MSVRPIAQQDPVPNLTTRYGQAAAEAQRKLDSFVTTLRELDQITADLESHGVFVDVDLGVVGNQAAAARRDLERDSGKPTFTFPKPR